MQWLLEGAGQSPSLLESEFSPYPTVDRDIAPLLDAENVIQRELIFLDSYS